MNLCCKSRSRRRGTPAALLFASLLGHRIVPHAAGKATDLESVTRGREVVCAIRHTLTHVRLCTDGSPFDLLLSRCSVANGHYREEEH